MGIAMAMPGVRKYARENGIDIEQVPGTGGKGNITNADVQAYLHEQQSLDEQAGSRNLSLAQDTDAKRHRDEAEVTNAELEERVPFTSIRKLIAQAMVRSKQTAPHVAVLDEVNVSTLVDFRNEMKSIAETRGVKLTFMPFLIKALVAALRKYPMINSSYDEKTQELVIKHYYHVGIATDTPRGLVVPVIRHADKKDMLSIAAELKDISERARANKLGPAEMKGSTISITNIGPLGGLFFTPIINYPEVAIVGVNRVTEKPIVKDGAIVPAHIMALSLSFDHRVVDGGMAQRFINELKRLLENPKLLMMEV